ncbi:MAG TPA: acetate--CoA ligase, partial [Nitrospiraceae bacterium]
MTWAILRKSRRESDIAPNLSDYADVCSRFSWTQAEQELEGLPHNLGLNIAHEAIDRHANGPLASQLAMRWLGKNGAVEDYSYGRLKEL